MPRSLCEAYAGGGFHRGARVRVLVQWKVQGGSPEGTLAWVRQKGVHILAEIPADSQPLECIFAYSAPLGPDPSRRPGN